LSALTIPVNDLGDVLNRIGERGSDWPARVDIDARSLATLFNVTPENSVSERQCRDLIAALSQRSRGAEMGLSQFKSTQDLALGAVLGLVNSRWAGMNGLATTAELLRDEAGASWDLPAAAYQAVALLAAPILPSSVVVATHLLEQEIAGAMSKPVWKRRLDAVILTTFNLFLVFSVGSLVYEGLIHTPPIVVLQTAGAESASLVMLAGAHVAAEWMLRLTPEKKDEL